MSSVDKMNLNEWMGTTETTTTNTSTNTNITTEATNATPFLVPANMDIELNAKAGKVTYDKVDYSNISGVLQLANETVKLQNVKADALDGSIVFNGTK